MYITFALYLFQQRFHTVLQKVWRVAHVLYAEDTKVTILPEKQVNATPYRKLLPSSSQQRHRNFGEIVCYKEVNTSMTHKLRRWINKKKKKKWKQ